MKKIKVLSLFDGISCGHIALERAGFEVETYYASEIDESAIKTAKYNYPNTIHLGDVFDIDFTQFIGKVDMVIGGSPCQKFSSANSVNRETNLDGIGGSLFRRFKEAVDVIKPKYFFLENVVSMVDNVKDCISQELGVEPIMINSALVSAQQRKRYYWCNWTVEQPEDKNIYFKDILLEKDNLDLVNINKPKRAFNQNPSGIGQGGNVYTHFGKSPTISANGGDPLKIVIPANSTTFEETVERYNRTYIVENNKICLSDTIIRKTDLSDGEYKIRRLTPLEHERLQTLPDGYTDTGISKTQRIHQIGNGWTVDVIAHIFEQINK